MRCMGGCGASERLAVDAAQFFQKIKQLIEFLAPEPFFEPCEDRVAFVGMVEDQLAAFGGDRGDGAAAVLGVGHPGDESFLLHRLGHAGETWQEEASLIGEHGEFKRPTLFEDPQNPPFLLVDVALRQHLADRTHDRLTRPEERDGQRTAGTAQRGGSGSGGFRGICRHAVP